MMPEQQSFVLYIVVGSGSKSGSRLPKTAPGAVFKVRLHGSLATGQKTAPGFQKWLGEPPQRWGGMLPKTAQNRLTSFRNQLRGCTYDLSFLCSRICRVGPCFWSVFLGVGGLCLAPSYQFPWQYKRLLWPKIGGLQTHKQRFQSSKTVTIGLWWTTLLNSPACG